MRPRCTGRVRIAAGLLALGLGAGAHAQEETAPGDGLDRQLGRFLSVPEVRRWFEGRFSADELRALTRNDIRVGGARCNCSDEPVPHFPQAMVILSTPKGELVSRFEGDEGNVRLTPLAVREGTAYCPVSGEGSCYGDFAHPCEFSDARFGPGLSRFFPTCKQGGAEDDGRPNR